MTAMIYTATIRIALRFANEITDEQKRGSSGLFDKGSA